MNWKNSPRSHNGKAIITQAIDGAILTEATYAPNFKVSTHSHRHACLGLVIRGAYTEAYQRTALECKPLQLKFRPAEEAHSNTYYKLAVRCFFIEFETQWLQRMGKYSDAWNVPTVLRDSSLVWLVMKLRRETKEMDALSPLMIEGLLLEIAVGLSRYSVKISERKHPKWLTQARDFIHDSFTERLTLSDVAEIARVHPVYLATVFRQFYGCSVGEYIRRLRVEYACRTISTSNGSLAHIALDAGFSHQSQFSRTFKRVTGLTPAQYRSAVRSS